MALAVVAGIDASARGQNLRGQLDGVGKVAGDVGQGGDEEIAEVVSAESVAGLEAIGEELRQQVFFVAEGDHAVAQVAGRQHVEVLAQAAGGTAVVGDGDDRCEIGDVAGLRGRPVGKRDMAPQSAQQRGEASAAADGNDAEGRGWSGETSGA